jgi:formiminotetrahydrofolate cyclodeaminase
VSAGAAVADDPTSVDALLARIASPGVLAGGGAAVALTGAAAAALVSMVAAVAARHAPDASASSGLAAEAEGVRRRLADLIGLDVLAYGRVLEARRDPGRPAALRDALVGATEIPVELGTTCVRILEQCLEVLTLARPSTVADVGVAGVLAAAALEGAIITARANLDGLDDPAFVAQTRRTLDRLRRRGAELRAGLARTFPDTNPGADAASR